MIIPVSIALFLLGVAWFIAFELLRLGRRFEKSLGWMLFIRYGGILPLATGVILLSIKASQMSAGHCVLCIFRLLRNPQGPLRPVPRTQMARRPLAAAGSAWPSKALTANNVRNPGTCKKVPIYSKIPAWGMWSKKSLQSPAGMEFSVRGISLRIASLDSTFVLPASGACLTGLGADSTGLRQLWLWSTSPSLKSAKRSLQE
jgi:hypothetical protein